MKLLRKFLLFTVLIMLFLRNGSVSAQKKTFPFEYGEKDSCEFYLNRIIPSYNRSLPVSADDPARFQLSDDAHIYYEYGSVYQQINDYYSFNWIYGDWEGSAPRMDPGVMIGGNSQSRLNNKILDADTNDYNRILPYASIFIDSSRLGYNKGKLEYQFYSNQFALNMPEKIFSGSDVQTSGENADHFSYHIKRTDQDAKDWTGVIYTGGIPKTIMNENGTVSETVLEGENGLPLFTVRYRDAALDRNGKAYDLVLSFTRITFAAEDDVTGPITLMTANGIFLSSLLVQNDDYLVSMKDSADEGIRIGARFELDYRLENTEGEKPDGLIFYSISDLDNASMALQLHTDANWGKPGQNFDYRWAEGVGIVRGAASFAVIPYYNHVIPNVYRTKLNDPSGNTSLVRISRMENTAANGTANGLLFTTWNTGITGFSSRNDGNSADTGFSLLTYPEGSILMTASAGARGEVSVPFFDTGFSYKIEQSASKGGKIYSEDYSFRENCQKVPNTDFLKVVGGGTTSTHFLVPDENNRIYRIHIDGKGFLFSQLHWSEEESGISTSSIEIDDQYGKQAGKTRYHFTRDERGVVSVAFENIQDAHVIHVSFMRPGLMGFLEVVEPGVLVAAFMVLTFLLLVLASIISWQRKKTERKGYEEFL